MRNRKKHGLTVCITQIVGTKKIYIPMDKQKARKVAKKTLVIGIFFLGL